ncbi:HTH-like domain-containing protein [Virgibacillus salinus]|uniref:5-methylcytosine-specific restriction enzyme B n=1 Tax=Virgibacillus salinus TaxID=553311 RepID=A0A1H0XVQ7_9BACI|nr:hypothetical protein [Virgibacillus salinus]SDQ06929.1 5-methylcytosine-specific restriction enzyme B [Virgibacillus salinus]
MDQNKLGTYLKEMYSNAPEGYQVANIHLFGIKYADDILKNKYKVIDIVRASGLKKSYATEVSKGIKLSKYVVIKD